ncbi:MAG: hypothetical protein ABSC06_07820 [Rhodopila sp.]
MDIKTVRAAFAEELRFVAHVRSERVIEAFATVPREQFLGDRPWQVADLVEGYWEVPGNDPGSAYHNVLFAIDPAPAIMAELASPEGSVLAAEIDPDLAGRARANLSHVANVEVIATDGASFDPGPADVVVVNAGATHPVPLWLDALVPGGRLLLPLTAKSGHGTVFRIERRPEDRSFSATAISGVSIYPCAGARTPVAAQKLARALGKGGQHFVRSLRLDPHRDGSTCWLHGDGYCFSIQA